MLPGNAFGSDFFTLSLACLITLTGKFQWSILVFFKRRFFPKINFSFRFFRYSWPSDELRQLQSPNTRVTTSVFVTGQRGRWLLSLRLQRVARCERHRWRWGRYSAAGSESHPVRFHERLDRPAGPHSNRLWYPREGSPFSMKLLSVSK